MLLHFLENPIISLFSQMVVDHCLVDFGTHVVGQTVSRVITMTNRGALGTRYTLTPVSTGPLQQTFNSTLVNNTDTSDVSSSSASVIINELSERDHTNTNFGGVEMKYRGTEAHLNRV